MDKQAFYAIATLIGNIIGAGVLGIPYVVSRSGLLAGLLMLIGISIPLILLYLYMGEISLRLKPVHQLAGMFKYYLKKNKWLMYLGVASILISSGSALVAYVVGGGNIIANIIGFGDYRIYAFIYFLILSLLVLKGLKTVGKSEAVLSSALVILTIVLSIYCFFEIKTENLTRISTNISDIFYPYGVILFACLGFAIVPQMEKQLVKQKKNLKKAIIIGFFTCVIIYAIFMISFVGKYGVDVEQIAVESLEAPIRLIGEIFVIASMSSSFLAIGVMLMDSMIEDYKMGKIKAWAVACWIPYLVTLLGPTFIDVLSISGAYFGGLSAIATCAIFIKARKVRGEKPEFKAPFGNKVAYVVAGFFILGIVYQTLAIFKIL